MKHIMGKGGRWPGDGVYLDQRSNKWETIKKAGCYTPFLLIFCGGFFRFTGK